MKIMDIPQSGKRGLNVSMNGRYGQVSRALVIPANPRSAQQLSVRDIFTKVTKRWRALTEAQRAAWNSTAKTQKSASRLGQSGPLTGSQFFTKVNATLETFGQPQVDVPPAEAAFPALAPVNLVITNTGGAIALRLTCPTDPGENTIVRASAPQSAGRSVCNDVRILGLCPAAAQGSANITGLYVAKYGAPAVGAKVFVRVNQYLNGLEDLGIEFSAIVPAAS